MATIGNTVVSVRGLAGHEDIAAALRHHGRDPHRPNRMGSCRVRTDVYRFGYTIGMVMETLSVREARAQLSVLLERFRHGDRRPVLVGSHRKTEAVLVPVAVFEELTAERSRSSAQAATSVRVEGQEPSPEASAIMDRWARGEISTAQMREQVRALHGVA
ncbi:type II toxin-antitoxin system prevent-host-death family antitoxin [Nocardia sp. NPDC059177]|uniref:type II toxin-antitoxin system prevent-host-death family antitoxin n=1 Tax=Nocardia sp. NPDC059177 TaxID=3346759 RepID=UPI0036A2FD3F